MQLILPSPFLLLLLALVPLYLFVSKWLTWHKRLPPGSMGWPYVGETKKFYTENPNTFFKERKRRYGDVFKSRILGYPCVMISSPEAVKNILMSESHLFKPTYPRTKERLIGPEAIFFHQGDYHAKLRKLIQSSFHTSSLRNLVVDIERLVLGFLPSWENKTVNCLKEMKKFTMDVSMILVFGEGLETQKEAIRYLYECLDKGYNSMPINIPGFQYRNSLMARKKLNEKLRRMIENRRESRKQGGGLLGIFLNSKDRNGNFSDAQIADNIIGVLFAARDTTSTVITWIIKYLYDNADLLATVTREQEGIQRKIVQENRRLKWEDTRKMPFTHRVIQETLRSASVTPFLYREAVEDIEFEGYLIPKGWKVLPLFRNIHHSEDFFPQPEKFDPSRFEVAPKPNTYIPFGNGTHACPGNELAKLEMFVLIHHLTTTYRWEVDVDDDGIQYCPFLVPKNGLPIRVTKKNVT